MIYDPLAKFRPPARPPLADVDPDDDEAYVATALEKAKRRQLYLHYAQLQRKALKLVARGYLLDTLDLQHVDHPTQHLAGIVATARDDRPITTMN